MSRPVRHLYEFGPFRLDPTEHQLLRDGAPVALTPKAFETLVLLVQNNGHLVEKDELMKALWPDSFVEEANLTRHVWTLRKALGETKNGHQYIETVPKRGYRFVASVSVVDAGESSPGRLGEGTLPDVGSPDGGKAAPSLMHEAYPVASGEVMRPEGTAGRPAPRALLLGAVLVLLAGIASYFALTNGLNKPVTISDVRSIAVLPFRPVGPASDEYLELGMADTLITRLSSISRITVRPTSSVRNYAGPDQDPVAIGRKLSVDSVLEGTIQKSDDRIRVTARLLRVADGRPLWAAKFDEQFANIFSMQDSISEQVSRALVSELSGTERKLLAKHSTENVEAYRLYLSGRYFWNKRTGEGFRKAIEYFNQAIEKDPNFALAYVGLADSYVLLADYDLLPPLETQLKAKVAATKALEIDETLAEAHASLADIIKFYDWDWAGAEREYRRAIELNPNYATAHQWYAEYLSAMGRHEEAVAEIRRAQELDPVSLVSHSAAGWVLFFARRYDEAITECRKVIEMDPSYFEVYSQLRRAYEQKGMYGEAAAANEKYRAMKAGTTPDTTQLRESYPSPGAKAYWQERLAIALKDADREVTTLRIAEIYTQLGEKDRAFEWLEKAYQEHSFWMPYLAVHPHLDPLRSDARFTGLLRRVRLRH